MDRTKPNQARARVLLLQVVESADAGTYTVRCEEPQYDRILEMPVNTQARKDLQEVIFALDDFIGQLDAVPIVMVSFNHDHPLLLRILDGYKKECIEQASKDVIPDHKDPEFLLRKCTVEELLTACGIMQGIPATLRKEDQSTFMMDAFNFSRHYLGYQL